MRFDKMISVIIPAINEEKSIARVIGEIPDWVDHVIVGDNGSSDRTPQLAREAGATVVHEPQRGYGAACLAALAAMPPETAVVVFVDGDYSDYPEEMDQLVDPIARGQVDLVIGSRVVNAAPGALTPQAIFGNWLATRLIRLFWGVRYSDLGPFRAISKSALDQIGMADRDYGWTVEMQIKAAQKGLRELEIPVRYRKRIGTSKVSGTIRGVWGAGTKILTVIFRSALFRKD